MHLAREDDLRMLMLLRRQATSQHPSCLVPTLTAGHPSPDDNFRCTRGLLACRHWIPVAQHGHALNHSTPHDGATSHISAVSRNVNPCLRQWSSISKLSCSVFCSPKVIVPTQQTGTLRSEEPRGRVRFAIIRLADHRIRASTIVEATPSAVLLHSLSLRNLILRPRPQHRATRTRP